MLLPSVGGGQSKVETATVASAIASPLRQDVGGTTAAAATPRGELTLRDMASVAAKSYLATTMNIPIERLHLASVEDQVWPDGCLGVMESNTQCKQSLLPGFRVMVDNAARPDEVHLNARASIAKLTM